MTQALLTDSRGVTISATTGEAGHIDPDATLLTDLSGWYGGVGVRTHRTDRLTHGDFSPPSTRSSRTLTMGIQVQGDSALDLVEWERMVSGLFSDGARGEITVTSEAGILSTEVELDGEVKPVISEDFLWGEAEIPLYAPDPHLYGPEHVTFLRAAEAGVGLVYPLHAPSGVLSYGSAIRGADPVVNAGNAEAWPAFLVVGDFPGGASITVGGRSVVWPWPITHGAPVEVRMSGSIWIGDANATSRATRREWSSIPPGGSISPEFAPLQGGTGWCEVHHHDTYI